jgi:non-homologous end joining protein Ku
MPPLRTGLLSFGLVSIPAQLHTATKDQHIGFHLLHDKCGSRIQSRYYCPVCNVTVERDDRVRGMSDDFEPENYRDEYRERVQAMLDEKSKGQEITVTAPEASRHGQIIDLMQALKQSIEEVRTQGKGDTS